MKRNRGGKVQGQRSISAFFHPKENQSSNKPAPHKPPAGKDNQVEAAAAASPAGQQDAGDRPQKKARTSPQSRSAPDAQTSAKVQNVTSAAEPGAYIIPSRNAYRHLRAQTKLAAPPPAEAIPGEQSTLRGGGNNVVPVAAAGASKARGKVKYTPLEEQVVALKRQYPGVLLLVEVGYKMRFFGEDALVASQVLNCFCYTDHNFLTASIPVPRLPVHVRRLVQAGYKVGVVRQVESAAIKAAGDNKYTPFQRKLTGLFTPATLDMGEKADKIGEEGGMETSQELEACLAASNCDTARYLLMITEHTRTVTAAAAATGAATAAADGDDDDDDDEVMIIGSDGTGGAEPQETASGGEIGVLAIEMASGDVAYGICCSTDSSSSSSSSSSSTSLEAVLLTLSPVEIVQVGKLSPGTLRLLNGYKAGATAAGGGGGGGPNSSSSSSNKPVRLESMPDSSSSSSNSYLTGAMLQQLAEFYGCSILDGTAAAAAGRNGSSSSSGSSGRGEDTTTAAAAVEASTSEDAEKLLSLPLLILRALLAAIQYLSLFGLTAVLQHPSGFRSLDVQGSLSLSSNTLRQLEVLQNLGGGVQGSLLHLLDRTATAAGGRLLRRWVAAPLANRSVLLQRQEAVQELLEGVTSGAGPWSRLSAWLSGLPCDVERGLGRVAAGTARPSELIALLTALEQVSQGLGINTSEAAAAAAAGTPTEGAAAGTASGPAAAASCGIRSPLLSQLLATAASEAVVAAAKGALQPLNASAARNNDMLELFKCSKTFPEVHQARAAVSSAASHLTSLLPALAAAAGVARLSYVTIQNQGSYLVELPVGVTRVPQGWEKVCGTKAVNRYHPPAVKEGMAELAVAKERLEATCVQAWSSYLSHLTSSHHPLFRGAAAALSHLDALQSLAAVAGSDGYCRPQFLEEGESPRLYIESGRHPTLDLMLPGGAVPNTVDLCWGGQRGEVITGPNMGGKSVYIRMAAVIAIMAQIGSWVPASSCVMFVLDGVYTRMGASDNIVQGRSTFMEELADAGTILQHATARSLVILDELGRGTSTHDGVAIATATLRHLLRSNQCLTLFVTHYPEVAAAAGEISSSSSSRSEAGAAAADGAAAATGGAADGDAVDGGAAAAGTGERLLSSAGGPTAAAATAGGGAQGGTGAAAAAALDRAAAAPPPYKEEEQTGGGGGGTAEARRGAMLTSSAAGTKPGIGKEEEAPAATATAAGVPFRIGVYHMAYLETQPLPPPAAPAPEFTDAPANPAATADAAPNSRLQPPPPAAPTAAAAPSIVFLYRLAPGAADQSFGLNVGRMAGLPLAVVTRAAAVAAKMRGGVEGGAPATAACAAAAAAGELSAEELGGPLSGMVGGKGGSARSLCCSAVGDVVRGLRTILEEEVEGLGHDIREEQQFQQQQREQEQQGGETQHEKLQQVGRGWQGGAAGVPYRLQKQLIQLQDQARMRAGQAVPC